MADTETVDQTLKLYIENNAVDFTNDCYEFPIVITGKNGCGKSTFLKNATDHLFSELVKDINSRSKSEEDKQREGLKRTHPIFLRFDREEISFLRDANIKVPNSNESSETNYSMQIFRLPDMNKYQDKINDLKSTDEDEKEIYLKKFKDIFDYLCFMNNKNENFIQLKEWKITFKDSKYEFKKNDQSQSISEDRLEFSDSFFLYSYSVKLLSENFLKASLYHNGMSSHDLMSIGNILKYFYYIKSNIIDEINDHLSNNSLQLKEGFKLIQKNKGYKFTTGNFLLFFKNSKCSETE
jgi:DNA mismatch repair ATPase MutS